MFCATACPLFVMSMLHNVRLYGPSHVCVDTLSVTLLECLKPKLSTLVVVVPVQSIFFARVSEECVCVLPSFIVFCYCS